MMLRTREKLPDGVRQRQKWLLLAIAAKRSGGVHLLGADWLPRKLRCHFLPSIGTCSTSADSLRDSGFGVGRRRQSRCRATNRPKVARVNTALHIRVVASL